MKKRIKKLSLRLISLILCFLSVFGTTAFVVDSAAYAAADNTVTAAEDNSEEKTGKQNFIYNYLSKHALFSYKYSYRDDYFYVDAPNAFTKYSSLNSSLFVSRCGARSM